MDWVDAGVLLTGVATAIFTGMQAVTTIFDRIAVDFSYAFHSPIKAGSKPYDIQHEDDAPQRIVVTATIHNRTNKTISLRGLKVVGVPMTVIDTYDQNHVKPVHGGFYRDGNVDVEVGGKASLSLGVNVDWPKLAQGHSSGLRDTALRSSVIIDRKSFVMPLISRWDNHPISAEIIAQNAEKAATVRVNQ